jgi:hypothetical protein
VILGAVMRLFVFTLVAFAATICIEKPAEAQSYPWCAYYNRDAGGATNCGFSTFQQCLATVSGVGGSCGANPQYRGSPGLYLSTKHARRHSY